MKIINSLKNYFDKIGFGGYILRLVTAFIISDFLRLVCTPVGFETKEFYSFLSLGMSLVLIVSLSILLCSIKSERIISILLTASSTMYFCLAAYQSKDELFAIGLCVAIFAVVYFAEIDGIKLKLSTPLIIKLAIVGVIIYTAVIGGICCLYYFNDKIPCYDFGLFSQMFYYMKETGEVLTTCERDKLLSHFAVHFSPIYYLLLPIYYVFPSPCTLLIMNPLIIGSAVIPLILLCRKYKLSDTATAVFALAYLFYPSFVANGFWYLHENSFLPPLILWMIYFYKIKRSVPTYIFAFLTLAVKEDAAVYVAVIALYFLIAHKDFKRGGVILVVSVVWFLTVSYLMGVYGEGIMSTRYKEYDYENGGLITVIKSVIQNPIFTIRQIFMKEKMLFVFQIFMPLGFLPLFIKKPAKLILLIPFLLVNMMTHYVYQYHIGFQYTLGSVPILMFLAVSNYADMGKNRNRLLLSSWLSAMIILTAGYSHKLTYYKDFKNSAEQRQIIDEALSLIPDDASVRASTFLLTGLSMRDEIYEIESTNQIAEYTVLDLRTEPKKLTLEELQNNDDFEEIYLQEHVIAVFKSK